MILGENFLGTVDFIVIGVTLLFSLGIGIFYGFCSGGQSNDELLVGGRKMGAWPIAASMLVSYLSAITILGYPSEVYTYGSQVFLMTIVSGFATPLSVYMFVSVLYKLQLTSAYKYLEERFDSVAVRWFGSLTFMLQLLFINGIVLYAPSIALEAMVGIPVWMSIIGVAICGTIYTSIGGLKAVVWTDVFQFVLIFIGMSAIVVKGFISSGGIAKTFETAYERGRLELFNLTVDPFMRHNTLNIILGSGFSTLCLVGTHQPIVQRYCSLSSFRKAVKAMLFKYILGFFTVFIVLLTGVAVFATFADCDPLTAGQIKKGDQILPYFVVKELSFIPGMMGLFVAVIFSAVLSTISSTLNSLAAVTWEDFLSKIPYFARMNDTAQTRTYRIVSIFYGIICVLLALLAQNLGSLFQSAVTVSGTTSGIQGAVFLMGVFIPSINKYGAITGGVTGLIFMCYLSIQAIILQKKIPFQQPLPTSVSNCSSDILGNTTLIPHGTTTEDIEWPTKLYTVSYILYPIIGGFITIFVGFFVSLLTRGWTKNSKPDDKYLHPLVRRKPKRSSQLIRESYLPKEDLLINYSNNSFNKD